MARYGYARVSTDTQTTEPQILALRNEGLENIVVETVSGSVPAHDRVELSSLLKTLQSGDSLTVARLDRLGRDIVDVLELVRLLDQRDIRLRILNLGIETGTSNGRLFLTILMAMAEFERELIRERTQAGIAAARAAGKLIGRPPCLTSVQRQYIREMAQQGKSLRTIARLFSVGRTTVHRILQQTA
ncbi:recombinase family protein [Gluconobacter japonicus]|uniref:recombinase family protein n=1 Tax=Gluconobacter japonicus TaxID=376620 RepID=UPI00078414DB|nr:recombinase family protein [Gluconobacter japonicus]KXV26736.1 DNA resolvase [Gluconobacter japonicus]